MRILGRVDTIKNSLSKMNPPYPLERVPLVLKDEASMTKIANQLMPSMKKDGYESALAKLKAAFEVQ